LICQLKFGKIGSQIRRRVVPLNALFVGRNFDSVFFAHFKTETRQAIIEERFWDSPDVQRSVRRFAARQEIGGGLTLRGGVDPISKVASHVGPHIISVHNVPTAKDAILPFISVVCSADRLTIGIFQESVAEDGRNRLCGVSTLSPIGAEIETLDRSVIARQGGQ
jgi:hypothetical protein